MNPEVTKAFLLAVYLFLSLAGMGHWIISRIIPEKEKLNLSLHAAISLALGFGVYSLFYFGLYSLTAEPTVWQIGIIQLPGFLLGLPLFSRSLGVLTDAVRTLTKGGASSLLKLIMLVAFGGLFALLFLNAMAPVKLGDAINGYLETSRWIYHKGLQTFDPYNAKYSTMPVLTEIMYSLSFALDSEIGAKIFDALYGFAFLLLIYGFSRRYMSSLAALGAALSFGVFADYLWLYGGGKIDVLCQFTWLASMFVLFLNDRTRISFRLIYLSAFLISIAAAQKFTNYILLPIWAGYLFYLLAIHKVSSKRVIGVLSVAGGIFILVVAPHFIKNYIWLGNPVAPFEVSLFPMNYRIDEHHHASSSKLSVRDSILFVQPMFAKLPPKMPIILLAGWVLFALSWKAQDKGFRVMSLLWVMQFIIWIAVLGEAWFNQRFIFGFLAIGIFLAFVGLWPYLRRSMPVQMAACLLLSGYAMFYAVKYKRHIHMSKFVLNRIDRSDWQDKFNSRGANLVKEATAMAGPDNKMFILKGGIIFYVPFEKLPYVATEKDRMDYEDAPDKLEFLRKNGFRYVFYRFDASGEIPSFLNKSNLVIAHNDGNLHKL